jgi:heat shock protein HslJ
MNSFKLRRLITNNRLNFLLSPQITSTMKKVLLFFLPFVLLLSCKPKPVGGVLENTNWNLVSYQSGGKIANLSSGIKTTVRFAGEKLSGNAACNSYFASFSTEGPGISISEMSATEKMCDHMEAETAYLGLLSKAQTYSAIKGKLEIFCTNGKLVFAQMSEKEMEAATQEEAIQKLSDMFPAIEGDQMPHLYPILRVDNPGDYPYTGSLVDTTLYRYFDAETADIWNNAGGEVFAVGKIGDLYVCRVPGRYVSSDIALFRFSNGVLTRSEIVAWAWCDEGWCNQQDAWLRDVNKDDRVDLVQHYTLKDDKGKIREERMTVMLQDESGSFREDKSLQPDKASFVMSKI